MRRCSGSVAGALTARHKADTLHDYLPTCAEIGDGFRTRLDLQLAHWWESFGGFLAVFGCLVFMGASLVHSFGVNINLYFRVVGMLLVVLMWILHCRRDAFRTWGATG